MRVRARWRWSSVCENVWAVLMFNPSGLEVLSPSLWVAYRRKASANFWELLGALHRLHVAARSEREGNLSVPRIVMMAAAKTLARARRSESDSEGNSALAA